MKPNDTQIHEGHMRVMKLGLIMNLVIPALIVLGGLGFRQVMDWSQTLSEGSLRLIFWIFIAASAGDLGAAFLLRSITLKPNMPELDKLSGQDAVTFIVMRYLVIFAVALSPSILGLVYYFLGGVVEDFILFGVISLLIYRLIRPKRGFFYSLFGARVPGVES